jgi:hypothetical protein
MIMSSFVLSDIWPLYQSRMSDADECAEDGGMINKDFETLG